MAAIGNKAWAYDPRWLSNGLEQAEMLKSHDNKHLSDVSIKTESAHQVCQSTV